MVYTVTFNPALDYIMNTDTLSADDINRASADEIICGGKGINVSTVLSRLGIPSKALGFAAGFTGEELCRMLTESGIDNDFIRLENGRTRINVKIRCSSEIDINAAGSEIPDKKLTELFEKLNCLENGDFLVLAGSVPTSLPNNTYERILNKLDGKSIHAVVDTSGNQLINTLKYNPFLIKPNHHELGEIFGISADSTEEITEYACRLKSMGAQNVLVSRGEKGAVLIDADGNTHTVGAVTGKAVSTTGCGDSMVGGFIAGYIKSGDYDYALRLATACGAATAFSKGIAEKEEIKRCFNEIR
ncbi:MAG: 1-phosphofructokinase [Oscillospiraceae bacterium]|nr:1-phosphofructokinase [Oscillospiraceae bacterium]